jgi:hypothetical protein
MVRIPSNPLAVREDTLQDLRDDFLVRCHAKNLSERTAGWTCFCQFRRTLT